MTRQGVIECFVPSAAEIAYSPDGRLLATLSESRSVKLWDAWTVELCHTHVARHDVSSVAFSPRGQFLAYTSWDKVYMLNYK
jgi:WD40 repeat protein